MECRSGVSQGKRRILGAGNSPEIADRMHLATSVAVGSPALSQTSR